MASDYYDWESQSLRLWGHHAVLFSVGSVETDWVTSSSTMGPKREHHAFEYSAARCGSSLK
ncbi:hypothetical protein JZ751_029578, partial [Albula glossodonta]